MSLPSVTLSILDASEPLRKRAPVVDDQGKPLIDFMMIIPGLKRMPTLMVNRAMNDIHLVLSRHTNAVVFAEFNTRLSLLWVSLRPIQGIRLQIANEVRTLVPGARLISHI